MAGRPPLLVILGATASGKSALADAVARRVGAEILSVDSMQVYRGMDVGTAKPTAVDRAAVRHHGIDLVDPTEAYTVARFVEMADAAIADAAARGVPVVATGGTPLYYKSLFEGLFDGPPADAAVRDALKAVPGDELHRRLAEVDPAAAARIHANDQRRVVRALEVYELTGRPISSFQTEWADPVSRHRAVWIGLNWDKDVLNRRINARVRRMVAAGWVDEVRTLLTGGPLSHTAAEATGYAELIEHVTRGTPLDESVERVKIGTRQLARRQTKWFRRFPNVTWLPGDRPVDANADAVAAMWQAAGRAC